MTTNLIDVFAILQTRHLGQVEDRPHLAAAGSEDADRAFMVKVQSAMGRMSGSRAYPLGNLARRSGRDGIPLPARPVALETVPLLGAMGSVGHPASPVWGAGLGQGIYPGPAAGFTPAVAPAAPVEPHPLEPGFPIMPVLGVVTAVAAVAYMILR